MTFPFPVSPSQIETARRCWRLYGLVYIDGVETESNEFAVLGTKMHDYLERWFKKGVLPPAGDQAGRMARVAMKRWPAPRRIDEVEQHLHVQTERAWFHGYQDVGYRDAGSSIVGKRRVHLRVVGDHKSTSSHRWALKKDELRQNPQALIYSAAAMVRHGVDHVLQRWNYTTRGNKPRNLTVEQTMSYDEVLAEFPSLEDTAEQIYWVRENVETGTDLPPNPSACGAYGGCSFADSVCRLTNAQKLRGYMAQQSLRDKIAANKAGKKPGQTVATPAGKPKVKKDESAAERLERLKAERASAKAEEEELEEDDEEAEEDEEDVDDDLDEDEDEEDDDDTEEEEDEPPAKPAKKSKPVPGKPTKAKKPEPTVEVAHEGNGFATIRVSYNGQSTDIHFRS